MLFSGLAQAVSGSTWTAQLRWFGTATYQLPGRTCFVVRVVRHIWLALQPATCRVFLFAAAAYSRLCFRTQLRIAQQVGPVWHGSWALPCMPHWGSAMSSAPLACSLL